MHRLNVGKHNAYRHCQKQREPDIRDVTARFNGSNDAIDQGLRQVVGCCWKLALNNKENDRDECPAWLSRLAAYHTSN